MLVIIDNYDSFTYNLVHYLGELGADCRVFRNDAIAVKEVMVAAGPRRHRAVSRTRAIRKARASAWSW